MPFLGYSMIVKNFMAPLKDDNHMRTCMGPTVNIEIEMSIAAHWTEVKQ
jgi:hypothetical protein